MDRTKAVEQAKALVAQMTLEEKAGQLRYDAPTIRNCHQLSPGDRAGGHV